MIKVGGPIHGDMMWWINVTKKRIQSQAEVKWSNGENGDNLLLEETIIIHENK